jgi:hypothetical protein
VAVAARPAPAVGAMMRGPIELQAAAQAGPGPLQQAMAARLVDEAMEREFGLDAGVVVTGIDGGDQRVVALHQLAAEARVAALPKLLDGEDLERGAERIDLVHVIDRQRRHVRAGVGHGDDQPFLDQLPQRLAQRPPADIEALRQRRLDQRRAGRDIAGQDRAPQALGDTGAERALGHGVEEIDCHRRLSTTLAVEAGQCKASGVIRGFWEEGWLPDGKNRLKARRASILRFPRRWEIVGSPCDRAAVRSAELRIVQSRQNTTWACRRAGDRPRFGVRNRTGWIGRLGIKFLESLTLFGFFQLRPESCVV